MATEVMNFAVTWEKIFAQTLFSSYQCDYFHHSKMTSVRFYMANVTWRMRTRREKRKLQKDSIRGIFQLKEEEGTFAFFHYSSWCFIFFDITIICFTPAFLLKFFLPHFLIFFVKTFSIDLEIKKFFDPSINGFE